MRELSIYILTMEDSHKDGKCDCGEMCACGADCNCKTGDCSCENGEESCCKEGVCVCHEEMSE